MSDVAVSGVIRRKVVLNVIARLVNIIIYRSILFEKIQY